MNKRTEVEFQLHFHLRGKGLSTSLIIYLKYLYFPEISSGKLKTAFQLEGGYVFFYIWSRLRLAIDPCHLIYPEAKPSPRWQKTQNYNYTISRRDYFERNRTFPDQLRNIFFRLVYTRRMRPMTMVMEPYTAHWL